MARPREFDYDKAVEGALDIFWRQGYGATNLPDLLTAMKLTRGSFYKAFDDKRSAYLAALERYDRVHISGAVDLLSSGSTDEDGTPIHRLFNSALNAEGLSTPRGCFICNAIVELGPVDPAVAQRTCAMTARLQAGFDTAVKAAIGPAVHDETRANHEQSTQKAELLTNLYFGAQALVKSGRPQPDWSQMIDAVLEGD